jgi:hypothetical protein
LFQEWSRKTIRRKKEKTEQKSCQKIAALVVTLWLGGWCRLPGISVCQGTNTRVCHWWNMMSVRIKPITAGYAQVWTRASYQKIKGPSNASKLLQVCVLSKWNLGLWSNFAPSTLRTSKEYIMRIYIISHTNPLGCLSPFSQNKKKVIKPNLLIVVVVN